MSTTRAWILLGCLAGGTLLGPATVRGQVADDASVLYGDGVHAYFRGNSTQAESSLSGAIMTNSQDPRIYYFRALSLMRLGRTAEARGDMSVGAALEARQPNRFAIGKALERVQGHDRLLLEQFRRQARLDAVANGPVDTASHAVTVNGGQSDVLRERVVVPLDEFLQPVVPTSAPARAIEPAGAPRTFAEPPAADRAAPPATADDPFRDDPQPPMATPRLVPPAVENEDQSSTHTESDDEPSGEAPSETVTPEAEPQPEGATPEEAPVDEDGDPFGIF